MATFSYRALSLQGDTVTGMIEASTEAEAIAQVRAKGLLPVSAKPQRDGLAVSLRQLLRRDRLSGQQLALFAHQLAVLLEAGLDLERALGVLSRMSEFGHTHETLTALLGQIRQGGSLAYSLKVVGGFPPLLVSLVQAGEVGGSLPETLRQAAAYLERSEKVRQSVLSALIYPAILLVTAGLSIVMVLLFVLPAFEPMLRGAGAKLPLSTQMVMGFGHAAQQGWPFVLGLFTIASVWLASRWKDPEFQLIFDGHILKLPLLGSLFVQMQSERFARAFGTLISNGVEAPTALKITSGVLTNKVFAHSLTEIAQALREGGSVAHLIAQQSLFPPTVSDFVKVGEDTGRLGEMLLHLAQLQEQQVTRRIERLVALITPGLTLFLGGLIAWIVAAILGAVLSINELAI